MLYALLRGHKGLATSNCRSGLGLTGPADPRAGGRSADGGTGGTSHTRQPSPPQPSALSTPVKPRASARA
jgi:hypothetical protein